MDRHEWRKEEKELYFPKVQPMLMTIPTMKYIKIKGEGSPTDEVFSEKIAALYKFSYTLKMMPKHGEMPNGYFDYVVYPLEGAFDAESEKEIAAKNFQYDLMIRQPDFLTEKLFQKLKQSLLETKWCDELYFEEDKSMQVVQAMHIGPFQNICETTDRLQSFLTENQLMKKEKGHKEIYLSDPKRAKPENWKTVVRFTIKE